jgi:hypothetical protein
MRFSASFACASGNVSVIARTPVWTAKRRVSSESFAVPLAHAWTDWSFGISANAGSGIGSDGAATRSSCPCAPRPFMTSVMASALGAVATIRRAPPMAASACPAEPLVASM